MDKYLLHEEYYKSVRGEDGEEPLEALGSPPHTNMGSYPYSGPPKDVADTLSLPRRPGGLAWRPELPITRSSPEVCPAYVEESHSTGPTYGAFDRTPELLAKLLSGSEDPDVTALSEAVKARLGITEPLPNAALASSSPRLSTLAEDLKRSRVSGLLPKVICPSPFHPCARTVPIAELQDVPVTETEQRGLAALAPLAGVPLPPSGLTSGGGKTGRPIAQADIQLELPEFDPKNLPEWAEEFAEFLLLTGQSHVDVATKCSLLKRSCKKKFSQKQVKQIVKTCSTWAEVLQRLEKAFPVYETDLSVRTQKEEHPMLPESPSAARLSEYVCDLEYLFSRMNVGSYGATETHLWLISKIPTRTWDDCRTTSERKSRTHTYHDLVDLLIELALDRENDSNMVKFLKKHLGPGGTPTPERGEGKGPENRTNSNQSCGKGRRNLRAMNEIEPGAGTPPFSYCKPVNDKGGACHAPDCDLRSGCMPQMKRQQHTKDEKTVIHQDHFRCTITCGYCGKRRHYEDEYQIKKRESDKNKRQEAERQKTQTPSKTPQNGDKGGKGGGKAGGKGGTTNSQRRSSALATSPSPAGVDPKRRPQGDTAFPEGTNSKKRRLAWMAKSLMAAGLDVKFPAEEWGGGSEWEDLVFCILVKIRDQVFRAVLDTGATLSIVALRLLKIFKKTKTVAMRVGDGRTIHSFGGVDVTICLGDETLTQHCRVLDTDAFDIAIGTDFLRRNPQVKMLSVQRPYSLHCDFGSGPFSLPLELSGRKESGLRYAAKTNYRTENYQLARNVLENGLAALQVSLDEIQVELFASQQQHIMQLYCSKHLNNAFRFFGKAMGLGYANPPFSLLAKVLTKIAYEGGRVVMCTPDWGCSDEQAYWRRMLDRMTVGRVQLPDSPIYVPDDSDTAMQAPEWASFLSIVDGSLNPVPLCDLDQVLLTEVMAENRGLTLSDLK